MALPPRVALAFADGLRGGFMPGRNFGFVNSAFHLTCQDFLSLACVQLFCWMTLEDLNPINELKYYIEVQ